MKVYALSKREKVHRGRVSKKSRKKFAALKVKVHRDKRKADKKELRDQYEF